MPNTPLLAARVTITAKDINNNSVAKIFNAVLGMNFDYRDATLNIIDQAQGSFYFPIYPTATVTCVISGTGAQAVWTWTIS